VSTTDQCVASGVAWLDEVRPGWRDTVDLERFQMMTETDEDVHVDDCICSQVFAEEGRQGQHRSGFGYVRWLSGGGSASWLIAHGFATGNGDWREGLRELEAEWRRVIHSSAAIPLSELA
jgi:hypothetical protein